MLERTKEQLQEAIAADSGAVGLFLSGGSDSTLLLHMLLDIKAKFNIVCFDNTFTRAQRRQVDSLITKHDLRVLSYRPSNAYLIGDGNKKVSLVEEYRFADGTEMPFIRDAVHVTDRCAVTDVMVGPFYQGPAPIGFTLNLFGMRKTDKHYATGRLCTTPLWQNQELTYLLPLWDWTRKDVKAGLKHYNVQWPKEDTGALPMCLNCLCGTGSVHCPKINANIDAINWDPKLMQREFRRKYQIS